MATNTNKPGENILEQQLSDTEQDVIATMEMNQQSILDELESKADILNGSLNFAMDANNNSYSGFYQGLKEQVNSMVTLINKLRN